MRDMTTTEILDLEQCHIDATRNLLVRYPDLTFEFDKNGAKHLCSRRVNAIADDVEFVRACGFCNDSPYAANISSFVDGMRIYSRPRQFIIAVQAGRRRLMVVGWAEAMRLAGISESVIARVVIEAERFVHGSR